MPPPARGSSFVPSPGLPPIPPAGHSYHHYSHHNHNHHHHHHRSAGGVPELNGFLNGFRIPTWSTTSTNPMYARVAHRRASAAVSSSSPSFASSSSSSSSLASMESALRTVLDRVGNIPPAAAAGSSSAGGGSSGGDSDGRVRPLEDPHLVGEEAAARARRARLAKENGDDILLREDRRWDWFLGKSRHLSLTHKPPPPPFFFGSPPSVEISL